MHSGIEMAYEQLQINTVFNLPDQAVENGDITTGAYDYWKMQLPFWWRQLVENAPFGVFTQCQELRAEVAVLNAVALHLNGECLRYYAGVEELVRTGVITREQFQTSVTNALERYCEAVKRAPGNEEENVELHFARSWADDRKQFLPSQT